MVVSFWFPIEILFVFSTIIFNIRNKSTRKLYYINPVFEEVLKEKGLYSENLIQEVVENHGSVSGLNKIPSEIKRYFVTTHDIDPEWHVRIQAAFQRYADNAVSKTINFTSLATVDDVEKAYLLAWKLGCKGITVYRDGSKDDQVINTGSMLKVSDKILKNGKEICPECGGVLEFEGGCVSCKECGWSKCKL